MRKLQTQQKDISRLRGRERMTCKYCKDEFCTNADSPAYRNYCPCRDYDYIELCKFAEKGERINDHNKEATE